MMRRKILSLLLVMLVLIPLGVCSMTAGAASEGTVTLKLKLYREQNGAFAALSDDAVLSGGDVIKVVVNAKTDFITGSSNVQVFYNTNYFTPYMNGKAYTAQDLSAITDGYLTLCTKQNGYNASIADANLYLNSVNVSYSGGRVNCADVQTRMYWPKDWLNGDEVLEAYQKYDYVWANLTTIAGAPNDRNDGKGARLMKIAEQDLFAFLLQVKPDVTTTAADQADILIPAASIKGTQQKATNKTMFSKYVNAYTASAETPVSVGFTYQLSGANKAFDVANIYLSDMKLTYKASKKADLKLTGVYEGQKVTWKSSDTSVALVDASGTVKGIGRGTATLTATVNGVSATCKVTVSFTLLQRIIYFILYYVLFGWIWMK